MDVIVIAVLVVVGLLILKSVAGMFKFALKIAIYALIGLAVYRGLVYLGVMQ